MGDLNKEKQSFTAGYDDKDRRKHNINVLKFGKHDGSRTIKYIPVIHNEYPEVDRSVLFIKGEAIEHVMYDNGREFVLRITHSGKKLEVDILEGHIYIYQFSLEEQ